MCSNYYLYRHIRSDKNEPFYIGVGKVGNNHKKSNKKEIYYKRAFSKKGRNNFWNSIINKTDYLVEIILESNFRDFIIQKEIEFIKLYGRKDLNTGTLCNLTDGGDGNFGCVHTQESKNKVSIKMKGYKHTMKTKKVISVSKYKPIFQYDLDGNFIKEWECATVAGKILKIAPQNISKCCNGSIKTAYKYIWKFKNKQ